MELNKDDIHTSINLRIITYYLIVKWKSITYSQQKNNCE